MNIALSPARVRAGQRMLDLYSVAGAFIVAEEEAADALHVAMCDELVAARVDDLLATPETRARYAAYLDALELTHGTDQAMRAVIDEGRARLAAFEDDPEHPGSAPDAPLARTPDGADHTAPADEEAAA
jgi:hypothetical protein